jgi:hypothetical protein
MDFKGGCEMTQIDEGEAQAAHGTVYTVEVDGTELQFDRTPVTARDIMAVAKIPVEQGMVEVLEDGTQRKVERDESFELDPGRRLKKRPRFRRGSR